MASLASSASFCIAPLRADLSRASLASPSLAPPSSAPGVLRIECAHHVNKKATKKHMDRRPKKISKWDRNRGGTKDYGPWPETPQEFALEAGSPPAASAAPAS